jgi:hypothetical protein
MTDLPAAIQPEALTEALRRCGVLGDGCVSGVSVDSSRETILSRIIRLRLAYDGAAEGAPRSVFLKTGLPERIGAEHRSGPHEVAFYRDVASAMPRAVTPRCFDGSWDAETHAWHLLLEDLTDTHGVVSAWPLPPSREESERIVATWARFHAAWWDDPRLGDSVGRWADPGDGQLKAFEERLDGFPVCSATACRRDGAISTGGSSRPHHGSTSATAAIAI